MIQFFLSNLSSRVKTILLLPFVYMRSARVYSRLPCIVKISMGIICTWIIYTQHTRSNCSMKCAKGRKKIPTFSTKLDLSVFFIESMDLDIFAASNFIGFHKYRYICLSVAFVFRILFCWHWHRVKRVNQPSIHLQFICSSDTIPLYVRVFYIQPFSINSKLIRNLIVEWMKGFWSCYSDYIFYSTVKLHWCTRVYSRIYFWRKRRKKNHLFLFKK